MRSFRHSQPSAKEEFLKYYSRHDCVTDLVCRFVRTPAGGNRLTTKVFLRGINS